MKRNRAIAILVAALLCLLMVGGVLAAESFRVARQVLGSGGERVTSANLVLVGTLGEAIATERTASEAYGLSSGFWWSPWYASYLPLILNR